MDNPTDKKETVVRLSSNFLSGLKSASTRSASRVASVVLDAERAIGFDLSPDSRNVAVTLFMAMQAMVVLLESAEDPKFRDPEDDQFSFVPADTFFKIVECSELSVQGENVLLEHGISLELH